MATRNQIEDYIYHELCPIQTPCYCMFHSKGAQPHRHTDFYEFCLVTNGSYTSTHISEKIVVKAGEILFMRLGAIHSFVDTQPNSNHYAFMIRKDYFEEFMKRMPSMRPDADCPYIHQKLTGHQLTYLIHIASSLATAFSSESMPLADLFLTNLLFAVTNEMITTPTTTGLDIYAMDLQKHYDNHHLLADDITELHTHYPISHSTLSRSFKKLTGCSILEYRTRKRMEYAAQLLESENYHIGTIANILNIADTSYFTKQFKKYYGMTPREYQKRHCQK